MQQDLQTNKLVSSAQVTNIGGGGGTNGLAKLATEKDVNTLMVMGYVMVGAVETNGAKTRLEDTTPIARLTEEPLVLVVPASSKYQSVADLVADIKANGKGVAITGGSAGGADHILAGQILKSQGVEADKLNYIGYSGGGESIAALLGNKVQAGISGVGEYAEQVKAGKVRALAVSGKAEAPALPGDQAAQGPGDRRRADQLARRGGPRVHRRRPAREADRGRHQAARVRGLEVHPDQEQLGRRLPGR